MIQPETITTHQAIITDLEQHYIVEQPDEVAAFLTVYPFLLPVLAELPAEIERYFPATPLYLEVYRDHEIQTWVYLRLIIGTEKDVDEAFEIMDRVDTWWFNHIRERVQDTLHIDFYR